VDMVMEGSDRAGGMSSAALREGLAPLEVSIVSGIDCMACQYKFFVNNSLEIKGNDEHALDFAFHLSRLFRPRCVWTSGVLLVLSSPKACLIIVRASVALFQRFVQNLMFLCRIYREIASGQIHDSK
jgi:hypothetical protein